MYKCKRNKICNFAKHTCIKERKKQNISCCIAFNILFIHLREEKITHYSTFLFWIKYEMTRSNEIENKGIENENKNRISSSLKSK